MCKGQTTRKPRAAPCCSVNFVKAHGLHSGARVEVSIELRGRSLKISAAKDFIGARIGSKGIRRKLLPTTERVTGRSLHMAIQTPGVNHAQATRCALLLGEFRKSIGRFAA